jgi:D-alanyl-D-alanine carboxypeptidase
MQYSRTRKQTLSNLERSKTARKSANLGKTEDIPAALRSGNTRPNQPSGMVARKQLPIGAISIGLGILLAGGAVLTWITTSSRPDSSTSTQNSSSPSATGNSDNSSRDNSTTTGESATTDNVLNHLPYAQAPDAELVSIENNFRMRKAAAVKFQAMVADARSSGVNITIISAFRSVEDQKRLFFGVGAERGQQPMKRAEVSAPPKYSEHHTGYAVDIGDSSVPAANLNQIFETTPAYKWLKANAAKYSFELSFPKDNTQDVSYEPWHWRFVGDINSLETFYKAHNLKGK